MVWFLIFGRKSCPLCLILLFWRAVKSAQFAVLYCASEVIVRWRRERWQAESESPWMAWQYVAVWPKALVYSPITGIAGSSPDEGIDICCICCVGSDLCDKLITRSEKSYCMCVFVWVCESVCPTVCVCVCPTVSVTVHGCECVCVCVNVWLCEWVTVW